MLAAIAVICALALPVEDVESAIAKVRATGHHIETEAELHEFLTPAHVTVGHGDRELPVLDATDSGPNPIDPSQIIQIGEYLWGLVNDNTPVVDTKQLWAGAVPAGFNKTNWTALTGWVPAKSDEYYIKFENHLHVKLTEFKWNWVFKHHGTLGGVGKYVVQAGATINVAYAFLSEHLDVSMQALKPLNYGTVAAPIGGLDMQLTMKSHGKFKATTVGCLVTFKGDGTLTEGKCDKGTHHV